MGRIKGRKMEKGIEGKEGRRTGEGKKEGGKGKGEFREMRSSLHQGRKSVTIFKLHASRG
jgi:hypothetical protein